MRSNIVFLICIIFSSFVYATDQVIHECETETNKLMVISSSWSEIYTSAINLPPKCFDGYFAEGISDTIVRKAGSDWQGFLAQLANDKTGKFFSLVQRSINATLDPKDLQTLSTLAKSSCTKELAEKCSVIASESKLAITEINSNAK